MHRPTTDPTKAAADPGRLLHAPRKPTDGHPWAFPALQATLDGGGRGTIICPVAITEEDVRKVAKLARLELTDEQVRRFAHQLGAVLQYVDRLSELDVAGIEPMAHAVELRSVFREDAVRDGLATEAALANAPSAQPPFFRVPRVFDAS
jgi:aspartyl-tRNA(Asn)/glutamyl-tRNA(Gln) amidotransferase subunit C